MLQEIWSLTKKVLKFIFMCIVTCILTSIWVTGLVLVQPIYLFRFILILYAKRYRPDLGNILATRSAVFAIDDMYRKPKANIILISSVSGKIGVEEFRSNYLNSSVLATKPNGKFLYPELQQNISSFAGFPFWKWDKPFKIENHIWEYERDVHLTPELANELCTKELKTPLKAGQSPWEITLFPKCKLSNESENQNEERTGFLIKLHHAMADGFSILKFSSSAMNPDEEIKTVAPAELRRSICQQLCFLAGFILKAPFEFITSMIEAYDVNECHIPENKLSENILLAFSHRIPLEFIKNIKTSHDVSFTTVLLAAFTGALRSFMVENGIKVPKVMHSITPFPMPRNSEKLRNLMTTCFISLPVGLASPEERLLAIEKHLNDLKRSTLPITMFYILALLGALPTFFVKVFFKQYCTSTLISNFPGPQEQIRLFGRPLEDIMFTAGLLPGKIGIGFDAVSYNGGVRIQAAFNEALTTTKCPSNFMLEKVLLELQYMSEKHLI